MYELASVCMTVCVCPILISLISDSAASYCDSGGRVAASPTSENLGGEEAARHLSEIIPHAYGKAQATNQIQLYIYT